MPQCELTFRCPLPAGLHARPASLLAELAGRFASEITLIVGPDDAPANAKSVLSIVASDVKLDETCRLAIVGDDANEAHAALERFVRDTLPGCDDVAPLPPANRAAALPRAVRDLGLSFLVGTATAPGVAQGPVFVLADAALPDEIVREKPRGAAAERQRTAEAIASLCAAIDDRLRAVPPGSIEAGVLRAHRWIATDVELHREIDCRTDAGEPAGRAIMAAADAFIARLRIADSLYIRERIVDVQDIVEQLLVRLYGAGAAPPRIEPRQPSIVVARTLTPQQLLGADRALLLGLVVESLGATSHVAILARALGIPTLTDVDAARARLSVAGDAIVDADRGLVIISPSVAARRCYVREAGFAARRRAREAAHATRPGATADGRRLDVAANVSSGAEARIAFEQGADGIGLFRTEMLFLGRDTPPGEDAQTADYELALRAAAGRPVIIRTFDLGADKTAPYLGVAGEENPALGVRGLRLYERYRDVFAAQVRAILRASAAGPVWIMAPMVTTVDEAHWFRSQIDAQRTALAIPPERQIRVGVMIEVPALAMQIGALCDTVDFLSIGTNDLSQYCFAADRGNRGVAPLLCERHPAFLRLLDMIVAAARGRGRWVGLCGEMAGDPQNLALLVGLGLDEISVAPPRVMSLKSSLAGLSTEACRALLERACACTSLGEVERMIGAFQSTDAARPLIAPDLVMLEADAATQAEAIQMLVGALYAAGRTDRPAEVEEVIWAREATYSTHFGQGVAVPHCRTDAMRDASIAVARFVAPISWAPSTEPDVQCAILLAVRESDTAASHMRVLATLARRLMHEEFRARLLSLADADEMASFLRSELSIGG